MKKLIVLFALVSIFASCKNGSDKDTGKVNLLLPDSAGLKGNYYGDTSMAAKTNNNPGVTHKKPVTPTANTGNSPASTANTGTAPAPQKKGWSHAAKGAVIGAGAGAVAGAVIDKKHGQGAIIGAVAGAGVGYVIGRQKDKKEGRVHRRKKKTT